MELELTSFCKSEYPRLVRVLGLYCGEVGVAEELAQETLARAWRHWSKVRALNQPSSWTTKVAMNLAKSHYRRRAAERRANQRIAGRAESYRDPDPVERQALFDALQDLSHRQRAALILRFYLGMTFREAADVMDVPESTVKSLVHRGLVRLREQPGLLERGVGWHMTSRS